MLQFIQEMETKEEEEEEGINGVNNLVVFEIGSVIDVKYTKVT